VLFQAAQEGMGNEGVATVVQRIPRLGRYLRQGIEDARR
jgi:hypothetical protein